MKNIIPYIRRKRSIKQVDLARALEISPSYLCKIERGTQEPSEKIKESCALFLDVPLSELFPEFKDTRRNDNIDFINRTFKNKLWSIRQKKGIKQYELARMLGCTPSYLSKIEKGLQEPNNRFKNRCARILRVKEGEIFPL